MHGARDQLCVSASWLRWEHISQFGVSRSECLWEGEGLWASFSVETTGDFALMPLGGLCNARWPGPCSSALFFSVFGATIPALPNISVF